MKISYDSQFKHMLFSFVMKTALSLKGFILYSLIVHISPPVREKEDQVVKLSCFNVLHFIPFIEISSCFHPGLQVHESDSFALNNGNNSNKSESELTTEPSYHVALGSDNSWYLFTEKWIRAIYKTGFPNVSLALDDALPREIMTNLLDKEEMQWQKVAESEFGGLWCREGSLETWSWSLNVPVLSSLSEDDEVINN